MLISLAAGVRFVPKIDLKSIFFFEFPKIPCQKACQTVNLSSSSKENKDATGRKIGMYFSNHFAGGRNVVGICVLGKVDGDGMLPGFYCNQGRQGRK